MQLQNSNYRMKTFPYVLQNNAEITRKFMNHVD